MLLLLNSDYGAMKKTLKLNRFLDKVWASRHKIYRHIHVCSYAIYRHIHVM